MKSSRSMRIHQIWVFGLHHLVRRSLEKISGLHHKNRCCVYFCVLKHEWGRHFFDWINLNQSLVIALDLRGTNEIWWTRVVLAGGPIVEFSGEIAHLRTQKAKMSDRPTGFWVKLCMSTFFCAFTWTNPRTISWRTSEFWVSSWLIAIW